MPLPRDQHRRHCSARASCEARRASSRGGIARGTLVHRCARHERTFFALWRVRPSDNLLQRGYPWVPTPGAGGRGLRVNAPRARALTRTRTRTHPRARLLQGVCVPMHLCRAAAAHALTRSAPGRRRRRSPPRSVPSACKSEDSNSKHPNQTHDPGRHRSPTQEKREVAVAAGVAGGGLCGIPMPPPRPSSEPHVPS